MTEEKAERILKMTNGEFLKAVERLTYKELVTLKSSVLFGITNITAQLAKHKREGKPKDKWVEKAVTARSLHGVRDQIISIHMGILRSEAEYNQKFVEMAKKELPAEVISALELAIAEAQ